MSRPTIDQTTTEETAAEPKPIEILVGLKNNPITNQLAGVSITVGDKEVVCDPGTGRNVALAIINACYHMELAVANAKQQILERAKGKLVTP